MNAYELLSAFGKQALPRMLTQIARDPGTPFYGSCDRNWWHYKIRDFSSIIVQQAGYAAWVAADLPLGSDIAPALREWAAASARFWNQRAQLHGAFEEYYPFEQGYPPVAFSTLAMAKLAAEGAVSVQEIRPGLAVAAAQLLTRFEAEAANQQMAGTAALAMIHRVAPDLVSAADLDRVVTRILALQVDEGWFPEYHGPDLGYLTVTMDCLWDLYDVTKDPRCLESLKKSLECVAWYVLGRGHAVGMHNSRNTDYLVPYAIARLMVESSSVQDLARGVFLALYQRELDGHFLAPTDDRYWCHYIGHSVFRALKVLQGKEELLSVPVATWPGLAREFQALAGHARLRSDDAAEPEVEALVSARKGAIVTARWKSGAEFSDFGWVVEGARGVFITHWWSHDWQVSYRDGQVSCNGKMVSHREHDNTPWKHMALRLASFVCGRRLIVFLKKVLIFKRAESPLSFERLVRLRGDELVIEDVVDGLEAGDCVRVAPRFSKRHVASADSFQREDAGLECGVAVSREQRREGARLRVVTVCRSNQKVS